MKNLYTHILLQNNKSGDSASRFFAFFSILLFLFTCSSTFFSNVTYAQTISSSHGRQSFATNIDGKPYAWGYNISGQLGNNTTTNQFTPIDISSFGAISGKSIVSISSGVQHTIALDKAGKVYAWGYNHVGQLGNNTTVTDSKVPVDVNIPSNIASVAAGGHHNLALDKDGNVYRWGFNGNGLGGSGNIPAIINLLPSIKIKAIAAGLYHSMMLTESGTVYAWGLNSYGQLGYSTTSSISNTPKPITGLPANIIAIAAGHYHSMALTATGELYTWGLNSYGQLGNPGNSSNSPALVSLSNIKAIAAGSFHSLAISSTNQVYAWGKGDLGQLGDGMTYPSPLYGSNSPVQVKTSAGTLLSGVYKIAGGFTHSLAYTCDGKVYSWGAGSVGELGNGSGAANTSSLYAKPINNFNLRIVGDIAVYTDATYNTSIPGPINIDEPTPTVYARAPFTDALASNTAQWNWGDNTTSEGTANGSYIEGNHTYTIPGVYSVTLTLCGTVVGTYNYVVVYDPNGNRVRGEGEITSPKGALKSDPLLTGTSEFGLIARYNSNGLPTGATSFFFEIGDLFFNSSSYEQMRLVVNSSSANYKGKGKIDGRSEDYSFLLVASDGDVSGGDGIDRFRIRIWNSSTNEVVYDNNLLNAAENAAPERAIDSGDIIISFPPSGTRMSFEPAAAEGNTSMSAYPNPFVDRLTVNLGRTYTEDFTVTLYSTQGSPVADKAVAVPESGISSIELQVPGLKDGLYILQVRSVQGSKAIKVMKK